MDFFRDHHEAIPALCGKSPLNQSAGALTPHTRSYSGMRQGTLLAVSVNWETRRSSELQRHSQHCIPLNLVFTSELFYFKYSISKSSLAVEA